MCAVRVLRPLESLGNDIIYYVQVTLVGKL